MKSEIITAYWFLIKEAESQRCKVTPQSPAVAKSQGRDEGEISDSGAIVPQDNFHLISQTLKFI